MEARSGAINFLSSLKSLSTSISEGYKRMLNWISCSTSLFSELFYIWVNIICSSHQKGSPSSPPFYPALPSHNRLQPRKQKHRKLIFCFGKKQKFCNTVEYYVISESKKSDSPCLEALTIPRQWKNFFLPAPSFLSCSSFQP